MMAGRSQWMIYGANGYTGRLVAAEARRPFDLAIGPLLRAALLRLGPTEHLLQLARTKVWPRCSRGDVCAAATPGSSRQNATAKWVSRMIMVPIPHRLRR